MHRAMKNGSAFWSEDMQILEYAQVGGGMGGVFWSFSSGLCSRGERGKGRQMLWAVEGWDLLNGCAARIWSEQFMITGNVGLNSL